MCQRPCNFVETQQRTVSTPGVHSGMQSIRAAFALQKKGPTRRHNVFWTRWNDHGSVLGIRRLEGFLT